MKVFLVFFLSLHHSWVETQLLIKSQTIMKISKLDTYPKGGAFKCMPMPTFEGMGGGVSFSEEEEQQFEKMLIDYDHKEKPEEFIFEWCGKKFIQRGKLNYLTAIGARKVAAGKSMLCHLMMATSLCGEIYDQSNPKNKLCCLLKNCKSMYIDAEMGRSSTYTALLRIKQTCAFYGNPTPYKYKQRTLAASFESAYTDMFIKAMHYYIIKYKPNVLYVDNMVFILNNMDVNDATSAQRITELDALCQKYGITIILVAHGNKASEDSNVTGAAGTATMRLSAYGLAIEEGEDKEPNKFKRIITQKARQGGFDGLPDLTFHFLPFISGQYESVYPVLGEPLKKASTDDVKFFINMFNQRETMKRKEMEEYISKNKGTTERQASNIVTEAIKKAIIVKSGDGKFDPYKLVLKREIGNE